MLGLAIVFEHVYHHLLHMAEHSFVYGQGMMSHHERHAHQERAIFSKPLRLILFSRMGGEFMVLGFLAFTIWTSNQQNVFNELADMGDAGIRLPLDGSTYLHLMEEVHMQLFVANVLYFALCFVIVLAADQKIKDFEYCRSAWVDQIMEGMPGIQESDPKMLKAFKYWRKHFLDGCVKEIFNWQTEQPETFGEIMHSMKVEKEIGTITMEDLMVVFTGRFSFCSYVVFSLCSTVIYIINMSVNTMLAIICLKSVLAFFHRFAEIPYFQFSAVLSLMVFLFLLLVYYVTSLFKDTLAEEEIKGIRGLSWLPGFVDRWSARIDLSRLMLSVMQVLCFFLCHAWAGYMISKDFWNDCFQKGEVDKIVYALTYIILLLALASIVRFIIPDFAIVCALPPFFSINNKAMIKLVSVQVVDKKMVEAREAMKKKLAEKKRLEDEKAAAAAAAGGGDEQKDRNEDKEEASQELAVNTSPTHVFKKESSPTENENEDAPFIEAADSKDKLPEKKPKLSSKPKATAAKKKAMKENTSKDSTDRE